MNSSTMIIKPRMSEKAYALSQADNTYVFEVPKNANKHTVAAAVAAQYGVTVEDVRIMNVKGKAKRTLVKRSRPIAGRQSDKKRAYVTVKQGDIIPVFAAVEEAEKEAAKAAKKGAK